MARPVTGAGWCVAAYEPGMTAAVSEFKNHAFRQFIFLWRCMWPHEGVLPVVQNEGGFADGRNKLTAAAAPVVVIGAGEAMYRCGDLLVELPEVADVVQVDIQGEGMRLNCSRYFLFRLFSRWR